MSVSFALFLSPDGIALAHRQAAGHWAFIGDTSVDVDDLGPRLRDLCARGEARGGKDFPTLLILPDDQILYRSFDLGITDPAQMRARIEDELDGLTPYSLEEITFDFRAGDADIVQVAAVARETLTEALGFARQAGFNGVGFAASPPAAKFAGVPVFELDPSQGPLTLPGIGLEFGPDQWDGGAEMPAMSPLDDESGGVFVVEARDAPAPAPEPEPAAIAPDQEADQEPGQEPDSAPPEAGPELAPMPGPDPAHDPMPVAGAAPEPDFDPLPHAAPDAGAGATGEATLHFGARRRVDPDTVGQSLAERRPRFGLVPKPAAAPQADWAVAADTDLLEPPLSEPTAPETAPQEAAASEAFAADVFEAEVVEAPPPALEPAAQVDLAPETAWQEHVAPEETPTDPRPAPDHDPAAHAAATPEIAAADTALTPEAAGADAEPVVAQGATQRSRAPARKETKPEGRSPAEVPPRRKIRTPRVPAVLSTPADPGGKSRPVLADGSDELPPDLPPQLRERLLNARAEAKSAPGKAVPRPDLSSLGRRSGPGVAEGPPAAAVAFTADPGETPQSGGRFSVFGALAGKLRGRSAAAQAPKHTPPPALKTGLAPQSPAISPPPSRIPRPANLPPPPKPSLAAGPQDHDGLITGGLLGRRSDDSTGPSVRTWLVLTLVLILILALAVVWSALFLPGNVISSFFGFQEPEIESTDIGNAAEAPQGATAPGPSEAPAADGTLLASGEVTAPVPGGVEIEAIADGAPLPQPDELPGIDDDLDIAPLIDAREIDTPVPLPSLEETEALYAASGIWQLPPEIAGDIPAAIAPETQDAREEIALARLDPVAAGQDAVALIAPAPQPEVTRLYPSPPAFGSPASLGPEALPEPTQEGTPLAEGATLFAGTPPIAAQPRPGGDDASGAPTPGAVGLDALDTAVLAALPPTPRPLDLDETRERQVLGGLTLEELGSRRPQPRPQSVQELADEDRAAIDLGDVSPLAVATSLVPRTRPQAVETAAAAARASAAEVGAGGAATAALAPTVEPDIPSNTTVSREATIERVIDLGEINLMGVNGTPEDRTAIVRLPSGRFVTVQVGDRLDGGRVAAIGADSLQYVRGGQSITLEVPQG